MREEISLEEYKKVYREIVIEEEKKGFLFHLVLYIVINIILIAVNLIFVQEKIWFFYPLISWGIGLSLHYLFSIRWIEKDLKERETKAEYKAKLK